MRTWMKILIGIVVVIAGAIAIVFYATSDITKTADAFFQAVRSGDMDQVESHLSSGFKQSTDRERLQAFISGNGLDRFSSASWGGRSVKTSGGVRVGELEGSITLDDGGTVPLTIKFLKEDGTWKINAIEKDKAGISEGDEPEPVSHDIPPNDDLVAMVNATTQTFGRSILAKSMDEFYGAVSDTWQRQTTVEELNSAFKPFIDAELNLSGLSGISPVFDKEPTIGENGVLVIEGHYPSTPLRVNFQQKYVQEGTAWKLLGLNVNVKPVEGSQ
ncbi:MAG: hypothetical protein KDJ16_14555 [Hyphomicrobiales bacterium]|nr:hypothetical protein [Hyphomicrobiales bacterium]